MSKPYWRTYFVETKYSPQVPPAIPDNPKEIVVTFVTGDDDLRGGNDNVNVIVICRNSAGIDYQLRFDNVNNGKRWINKSSQTIARQLPDNYKREEIVAFRIETTFSGGTNGDNWNLNKIIIQDRLNGTLHTLYTKEGTPMNRFTGDLKWLEISKRFGDVILY
jgi:hypothetical protein